MNRMVYGNLAVKQDYTPKKTKKEIQQHKVTVRHTLPISEKLTYLLSVVIIVAVAGVLLSKYALLAETNYRVQEVKADIAGMQKEIDLLQIEVARLSAPDRIMAVAEEMGLTQREGNVKTVKVASIEGPKFKK